MMKNLKVYHKPVHWVGDFGEKHYSIGGVEVTYEEYKNSVLDFKRLEIASLIEADFSLPSDYKAILYSYFESAPAHDLQGSAPVAYGRYKRAFLFFLDFQDC